MMEVVRHLVFGRWSCGCETWPGKPRLLVERTWHDGWHYVLHVGPFWVECDY